MEDLVENVLEAASKKQASYKTTVVEKDIDLDLDVGNLLAIDNNNIDMKKIRSKKEEYMKSLARDNTQLLVNKIWDLPVERVEDAIIAKLPDPITLLPREKPIPKKKAVTKWEEYAQLKGIQNRKKGRKVWDDELQEWVPRWGYKSKNDEKRDWVLEVPENADPFEDQFEKKRKAKKERVAKNELKRLRNIARNTKGKVPGVGLTPTESAPDKSHLSHALAAAQKSDASLGRFSKKIPTEDKKAAKVGNKRKFESNTGDLGQEKKRALNVLTSVLSHNPIVDKNRAGNLMMNEEQTQRTSKNKAGSSKKRKGDKGGGGGGGKGKKRKGGGGMGGMGGKGGGGMGGKGGGGMGGKPSLKTGKKPMKQGKSGGKRKGKSMKR